MSASVQLSPQLAELVRAIGLVDADGRVNTGWFERPLDFLRSVLSDAGQRAALLQLLDDLFPPSVAGAGQGTARWHPLLDPTWPGQIFITIDGDVIGLAGSIATPPRTTPAASASLRIPLVDLSTGSVEVIAGSARGPLEVSVRAGWDPAAHPSAVSVTAAVDLQGHGKLSIAFDNLDPNRPGSRTEIDPTRLDAEATQALLQLVTDVLSGVQAIEPRVACVIAHLPGVLGLDPALQPLPVGELLRDPDAIVRWFAGIAGNPAALRAWFTHFAGLLGSGLPAAPTVDGLGSAAVPFRAPLITLGGAGGTLDLRLGVDQSPSGALELLAGIGITLPTPLARVEAAAMLVALPLGGAAPARPLPEAHLALVTSGGTLVDALPALQLGHIAAGVAWDGARVVPKLELIGVVVDGKPYPRLDLTDAQAVGEAASGVVSTEIDRLLGATGLGRALQALLGLVPPATDPQSPHRLSLSTLMQSPTRAIAEVHRGALADAAHSWRHLFAELATLLQSPGPVDGDGSLADPWRVALATLGPAQIEIAAWNARDAATPAGTEMLRLGLRLGIKQAPWTWGGVAELLAFDLRPDTAADVSFVGGLHATLDVLPPQLPIGATGLRVALQALEARASFVPQGRSGWLIEARGLSLSGSGGTVGPLMLRLPANIDPHAADLGLGVPPDTVVALTRLLLAQLLHEIGGPPAFVAGALIGLHRELRGLPGDWPMLEPPLAGDAGSLFADPLGAVRRQLQRIGGGISAGGAPFVVSAMPWVAGLLRSALPERAAEALSGLRPAGLGSYAAPWTVPLFDSSLELLCWLEPDGPTGTWQRDAARRVSDGVGAGGFLSLLGAVAPQVPDLADALHARGMAKVAQQLGLLEAWLAGGDGLVDATTQTAPGMGWTTGATVIGAHHDQPASPQAIAQILSQLDAWAGPGPRAVLLIGPPFADHRAWDDLLRTAEPARVAGAHFDFRVPGADPLLLSLDPVQAVARHYTADLADGPLAFLMAQLHRTVARVLALTGASKVLLVAHSLAGVAARACAAARPETVGGVVTLGTPHRPSPLAPLVDTDLAEAIRVAEALQPAVGRGPIGRAIGRLAQVLDGAPGYTLEPEAMPRGLVDSVPGLAIPGALDGDLIADLATAAIGRITDALAGAAVPQQAGFGARLRLDLPASESDELAAEIELRVDAWRAGLGTASAVAGTRAIELRVKLRRQDGWLAGGPGPDTPIRLRWAEFGARIEMLDGGGVAVRPIVRLHDIGVTMQRCIDGDGLLAIADTLPAQVPLSSSLDAWAAESGPAGPAIAALLRATGIAVQDSTGRALLSMQTLVATLREPAAQLGARLTALVDALAGAFGATAQDDGWSLTFDEVPVALTLSRTPWALSLRSVGSGGVGDVPLAPALAVGLDASLAFAGLAASAEARLRLGNATLSWNSAGGRIALDDGVAAAPLTLVPMPAEGVLRDELLRRLPPLLAGGLSSAVLEGLTGGRVRLKGLARLFSAPGQWLLSTDGLGAAGGGLDAARITAVLEAIGRVIEPGAGPAPGALRLPGGITLTVNGGDPLRCMLSGTLPLGSGGDTLGLQLGLALDRALAATPSGSATLDLVLPGTWGRIGITLGADASGLAISVAPAGADPIELLPRFSGFGAVAGGAALLLPRVLQAVVDELAPVPQNAIGLLRAALSLARALGCYDFDAQGFEAPARSAELAAMLRPGWLQGKANSGPAVAGLIADLLGGNAPVVPVPGTVSSSGSTVRWSYPIAGGATVSASLGWDGLGAEPVLLLGVQNLRIGPVVADELSAGYAQGLACRVALHLDAGGNVAFLQPALELGIAGPRIAFAVYPLGVSERADFAIRIAPTPELVLHPEAALALLERWGLPLAAQLLVRELADSLVNPVWRGGPTIRSVLEQAGVVVAGSNPPAVAAVLPPAAQTVLRALAALVSNVSIELVPDELTLTLIANAGRRGLRLHGHQVLGSGETQVELRFGKADWLDDPAAGITLWLLEDIAGMPPVRFTPALDITGFGVVLAGVDKPLLEGGFELGGAGAFLFADFRFLDAARQPALAVSRVGAGVEFVDARVNVASDDGDGFLQKVLPPELRAPFDLAVAYRDGSGLTIFGGTGNGGLELTFPLDLDLVLMRLDELFVALHAQGSSAQIEAALTGSVEIGPIFASVQRVGIRFTIDAAGARLGFRAPDALALSIDAGPVSGGGFLYIDEAKGQYAGTLQLQLQTISLTAIGLLNTKLPDGSPIPGVGFSLLIIVAIELPPIQLGFGFTLNGIGGLLGLNRTLNLAALRAGVRNHALDAMLFPPDPIRNAEAIVRTLSDVFPVAVNRFVIAPMVRLGWGTPTILALDLAIVLEVPAPIRVAILGRIKLALPRDDESAVVLIHLDVVGAIDFDRGEVSIDAVLYDSKIAAFTLSGEMALRARWKNDPTFVLAIGGFHPAFPTPPGFPSLARFAIALATGDNPRLRLEAYLAVTSNTLQFGAALDVHAEALGFALDGQFGFDALIQFQPFGLRADMAASFSVTWEGAIVCAIGATIHLTGPAPWHAWGTAHVQLLLISANVTFDAHIGDAALPAPPPPVRVADLLRAAIAEPANWSAQPPSGEGVVALRGRPEGDPALAHPLGGLSFRQRIAPLNVTLEHYGAAAVDGPSRLSIAEILCGGLTLDASDREALRDPYAAAQFLQMSDDAKLSRPSFELFDSGVALRFDDWMVDDLAAAEAAPLDYDVIVVDALEDGSAPAVHRLPAALAIGAAQSGPAGLARTRQAGPKRFEGLAAAVTVVERRADIASLALEDVV